MIYAWINIASLSDTQIVRYSRTQLIDATTGTRRDIKMYARGTVINVGMPANGGPTSYILTAPTFDTTRNPIVSVYRVQRAEPTADGYAVTAELCALQTLYANYYNPDAPFEGVTFDLYRYSAADTTTSNGISQNTSSEPVDGNYTTICDRQYQKRWTSLSDYAVVVTYVTEPGNTSPPVVASRRLASNRSYVLTDSSYNVLPAYSATSGVTTGMLQLNSLCQHIGAEKDKIYRIQLVPYTLATAMASTGGSTPDSRFVLSYSDGAKIYHNFIYNTDITAWQTVSYTWPTVANQKALGNPTWILRYNTDELVRLPARSIQSLSPISGYSYSLNLGGTTCNGVSMYVDVRGSSRTLALVSMPLPEISAVVNSSTVYWQTAGQQAVDRAALGLLTGGIAVAGSAVAAVSTGGALTPLLIGSAVSTASTAVNYAAEVARGQRQADNSVYSAGLGAGVVNASNMTLPQFEIWLERYPTTAVTAREDYFRRHGYTGSYSGDMTLIGTFPRINYISFAGQGKATIKAARLTDVMYSRDEFINKLNAELSQGVTVWASGSTPNYTYGNSTI